VAAARDRAAPARQVDLPALPGRFTAAVLAGFFAGVAAAPAALAAAVAAIFPN
jgi:hypothetical protein